MTKHHATKRRRGKAKNRRPADVTGGLPELNLNAAGIDVGGSSHYVAFPPGRAPKTVREFGSYTAELEHLADWLQECRIDTVAMESTGVYWFALYEILERQGIEVKLVNARQSNACPAAKPTCSIASGCKSCTPTGCSKIRFAPTNPSGNCELTCGNANR